MIRVFARVAADFGLLDNRSLLSELDGCLVMGTKMARLLGQPQAGWVVLSTAPVFGWEHVARIPETCTVVGGHSTYLQALGVCAEVVLIVEPYTLVGAQQLNLEGFRELERKRLASGSIYIRLERDS